MKTKIIGIAISIVVLTVAIWYYLASNTLKQHESKFQELRSQIGVLRTAFLESGSPKSEIRYGDLVAYSNTYKNRKDELLRLSDELKNRSGMAFWFPNAREETSKRIEMFVRDEDSLYACCQQVLTDLSATNIQAVELQKKCSTEVDCARATLNNRSDSQNFRAMSNAMSQLSRPLKAMESRIMSLKKTASFAGQTESMRRSVLSQFSSMLTREFNSTILRQKALVIADRTLSDYKSQVSRLLSSGVGTALAGNSLAQSFYPVTSVASEKTAPLREMIDELEKPLINESAFDAVGFLLGNSSGGSLSAMSLISTIDPSTGQLIGLIKDICEGIATAHGEVEGILQATQPLLDASERFRRTRSREHLRGICETAPQVSSYFESKNDAFDPITSRLDEGKQAISQLNSIAAQIPNARARDLVFRMSNAANEIISLAYRPFNQWHQSVAATSMFVENLRELESHYSATLGQLQSGSIESSGSMMSGSNNRASIRDSDISDRKTVTGSDKQNPGLEKESLGPNPWAEEGLDVYKTPKDILYVDRRIGDGKSPQEGKTLTLSMGQIRLLDRSRLTVVRVEKVYGSDTWPKEIQQGMRSMRTGGLREIFIPADGIHWPEDNLYSIELLRVE
ncbi:MAG: hypothetical protein HY961_13475 [Ignavibacteriae bacterium]|nr:hypothetical protein [Ignavibacteriota bacterium]